MSQLQVLPDDLLRIIFTFAAFSFKELVELLLVSKEFHRIANILIKDQLEPFKRQLVEHGVDFSDSFFTSFAVKKLPFWNGFNGEMCLIAKAEYFSELLESEIVSNDRLDRLFGHMLEHKNVFRKVSVSPRSLRFHDRECKALQPLQNSLIKYAIANITNDLFIFKFLSLCEARNIVFNGISYGIDYYYSRYTSFWKRIDIFPSSFVKKNQLRLLESEFRFSQELNDRLSQVYLLLNVSLFLDFVILFCLINWLSSLYREPKGSFLADYFSPVIGSLGLASNLLFYINLTWPLFYRLDLWLERNPEAKSHFKNSVISIKKSISDYGKWISEQIFAERRNVTDQRSHQHQLNVQQSNTEVDRILQQHAELVAIVDQQFDQLEQLRNLIQARADDLDAVLAELPQQMPIETV